MNVTVLVFRGASLLREVDSVLLDVPTIVGGKVYVLGEAKAVE